MLAEKTLFPELKKPLIKKGKRRDPFGRYDTRERYEAYKRKIERLRATVKYLLNLKDSTADAIRRRDEEIRELKFQLNQRNSIE